MPRGRPSLEALLVRVVERVDLLRNDYGGLPRAVEADEILREIWIEDTHHSSALEGNPLSRGQVERLLREGQASGSLSSSLEIEGYGRAARWVYQTAADYPAEGGVPLTVIRQVHQLLVEPAWSLDSPKDGSRPGGWRREGVTITGSKVQTAPPIAIDGMVQDWVDASPIDGAFGEHVLSHIAHMHAWFERIHPFADGNGRVGRLLMNFMLMQRGYPPAVVLHTSRRRYLSALELADRGNTKPLTELIARAIEDSISKFLIPRLAGDARLVPLASLSQQCEYSADYLRTLAVTGRLRAVKEGQLWLSSRAWLEEYRHGRSSRGRRQSTPTTAA